MLIELIAVVCTGAMACKDISITADQDMMGPLQCMMRAQLELAKWTDTHPGWQVQKWSCGRAGRYARA